MRGNSLYDKYESTLFDKLWKAHLVKPETAETPALLYIDLHLVHEVTSPQAFALLLERGLKVRRPERTVATMDHSTPTLPRRTDGSYPFADSMAEAQVRKLEENCARFGIRLHGLGTKHHGIVHVIGPELGLTRPGRTIVCGDSHTSTHGAFGALAFGIGTSEVGHVLATQCLLRRKPNTFAINLDRRLQPGVTAKDLILAVISRIGVGGGTGHVLEYRGEAIRTLTMEERMTMCNMSIEAGARAGLIAPDDTTYQYLAGREYSPTGADWDRALKGWRELRSHEDAFFHRSVSIDASAVEPMITYGTHPGTAIPINGTIPDEGESQREALRYMGLKPGETLRGKPVDAVFIGSCTNSRISDLREAAHIMKGRKVAPGVRVLVVPGSQKIKEEAETEGLAGIFRAAGAQWREPGCSMCIAMNGDALEPGQLAVSTSNRNFEGRQGPGSRTLLASPLTAAAAAVTGTVRDARELGGEHHATI